MKNNTQEFSKEKFYIVNGRRGQYELTTVTNKICLFMDDTLKYEYFDNINIKEDKEK